jgi:hypothetical protein
MNRSMIVRNGEGLAIKSFGPYGHILIDGGVIFMREDEYEFIDKCYKIPEGFTVEFINEEQGGFDQ